MLNIGADITVYFANALCAADSSSSIVELLAVISLSAWEKALDGIKQYFDRIGSRKLFLILSYGWVYEGYINEIISVVSETDGITIEDFYIVSPKFDSFAMFCSDGDCFNIFEA